MSSYHLLTKRAYAPPANPYGNISPTPSMGAPEWQSAPGLQTPQQPGFMQRMWRSKGEIAGNLGGWEAGAAAGAAGGAALGSVVPIVGTAVGGLVGGVVGGLAGGWGGGKLGEMGDNHLNTQADNAAAANAHVYRPPVTDMASYGANMLAQGIEQNRARPGQPT